MGKVDRAIKGRAGWTWISCSPSPIILLQWARAKSNTTKIEQNKNWCKIIYDSKDGWLEGRLMKNVRCDIKLVGQQLHPCFGRFKICSYF